MSEFFFFVKSLVLTLVMVLVMQIQVGERTLESHAMGWVQTSALVAPIQSAAHGGAKMLRDGIAKLEAAISQRRGQNKKEEAKKPASPFRWYYKSSLPKPTSEPEAQD